MRSSIGATLHKMNALSSFEPLATPLSDLQIQVTGDGLNATEKYAWMRPELMDVECEINHYYRYSILGEVAASLRQYAGDTKLHQFKSGPFGHLLELNMKFSSNNALHELLARELTHPCFTEYEKWFQVGGANVRFAPKEYALVTGLMFGKSEFDPYRRHHISERSMLRTKYRGERIKVSTLRRDFNAGLLETPDDYFKAANLLVYYLMLLGRDNPWIEDWAWVLVEDELGWSRFPWGSYSFQILCHQISILPKELSDINNQRNSYSFFGPVWAFNLWAFEAIPDLGRICGRRSTELLTPRLRRWETVRGSTDFGGIFDDFKLKCHFSLDPDYTEWCEPYFLSSINDDALWLRYLPPKRHAHKKIPPLYRQSSAHGNRNMNSKKPTSDIPSSSAVSRKRRRE